MADFATPSLRTFQVYPDIPTALKPLLELAHNLWWVWNPDAAELFRRLDRQLWEEVYHNPVRLLGRIDQSKLAAAAEEDGFLAHMNRVMDAFKHHLAREGWYQKTHGKTDAAAPMTVAYFSAEFGLHESLPIYSGGLGILAGDHLKSASEVALPLIGVGLLYRNGYFTQYLSADGWQQETYPELDFYNLPIEPQKYTDGSEVHVRVDLPDNAVFCKVWKVNVGRIPLVLLDTNLQENAPNDREITSRLYGGGTEMRIKQEIVLGIGGIRALEALAMKPTVFHMNEGHSAFLALERIRTVLAKDGHLTFDEARQHVMATDVFTTHTPVPAGIDMFPPELVLKYFRSYYPSLKLDEEGFLALGREDVTNRKQGFSMAVLAIRLADGVNGVSWLHGDVSRQMWHNVWPQVPPDEVPIGHVTNGIHLRSWLSPDISYLFDRYLGSRWASNPVDPEVWQGLAQIPDEELWRAHERARNRLVALTRARLKDQLASRGVPFEDVAAADEVLDPEALTIGFARRFATYKRGALLMRDPDRLRRLLDSTDRPVQFLFAGKAHPADHEGKELIRQIVNFARDARVRRRIVFIENYDINVARYLVQGVDVWLNTPRRGMEASGTSGMKAAANGVPNCSILDGWWVEGYASEVGWAIGRGETYADENVQDTLESGALYDILEKEIIPSFYKRSVDNLPREWIARMKACMKALIPVFNTNRQVQDYANQYYIPANTRGAALAADNLKRAVELAHAKDRLHHRWSRIKVVGVQSAGDGHFKVGDTLQVEALLELPEFDPAEVTVQIYAGPINAQGRLEAAQAIPMQPSRVLSNGQHAYAGTVACKTSGRHGFAVRVLPANPDLPNPFEPGLISWN